MCRVCVFVYLLVGCSGMLFIADNNDVDDDIAVVPYCVSQHGVYSLFHDKTSKIIYCR